MPSSPTPPPLLGGVAGQKDKKKMAAVEHGGLSSDLEALLAKEGLTASCAGLLVDAGVETVRDLLEFDEKSLKVIQWKINTCSSSTMDRHFGLLQLIALLFGQCD